MSAAAAIDPDIEQFRHEVRAWLGKNFPASLKGRGAIMFAEGGGPNAPDFPPAKTMGRDGA